MATVHLLLRNGYAAISLRVNALVISGSSTTSSNHCLSKSLRDSELSSQLQQILSLHLMKQLLQ
jgi:hypothetical protein